MNFLLRAFFGLCPIFLKLPYEIALWLNKKFEFWQNKMFCCWSGPLFEIKNLQFFFHVGFCKYNPFMMEIAINSVIMGTLRRGFNGRLGRDLPIRGFVVYELYVQKCKVLRIVQNSSMIWSFFSCIIMQIHMTLKDILSFSFKDTLKMDSL